MLDFLKKRKTDAKHIHRLPYAPEPVFKAVSTKNEPWYGNRAYKDYPDMHMAYKAFSRRFELPLGSFILTNGCENAARIAVLALKDKLGDTSLMLEDPGWGLMDVICESFCVPYAHYSYKYSKFGKHFTATLPEKTRVSYMTRQFNGFFEHNPVQGHYEYAIVDETYSLDSLYGENRRIRENQIVIGSFSKFCGPGLRLGYVIFPAEFAEKINLLREQYINQGAVDFICDGHMPFTIEGVMELTKTWNLPSLGQELPIISAHPTYITIETDWLPCPHKKFNHDGHTFCRVGRLPSPEAERKMLTHESH